LGFCFSIRRFLYWLPDKGSLINDEYTEERRKIFLLKKTIYILLMLLFVFQGAVSAQDASLANIVVNNTRDDLLLYLEVKGAFQEKIGKAIMNGVPASFSFYVILYRERNFWMDDKITEIDVTHTIKYNSIKKEYTIIRSWEDGNPVVTKSFKEAKKLMSEIKGMQIISLSKLIKGAQYQIKAKAELSKIELPLYLHYVFFFMSLWDFETDWYTVDFKY